MRKVATFLIALLFLLCACKDGVSENYTNDTVPAERILTACTDGLGEQELKVLTGFLQSTRIYLTGEATLDTPAKWSCRINGKCLLAVAQWNIGDEKGLQPVLIFEEDGQTQAAELGRDSLALFVPSPYMCNSPINLSFIQQVGNTTIIFIGYDDLLLNKIEGKPYDNWGTTPLCICNDNEASGSSTSCWIMSTTDSLSQSIYSTTSMSAGEHSYLFAIENMEDSYTLYMGENALTGSYCRSLLANAEKGQSN